MHEIFLELNDCVKYNSGYLANLNYLEISNVESNEILRLIRSPEVVEKIFNYKKIYHNQNDSNIYFERVIKDVGISEKAHVDAYLKVDIRIDSILLLNQNAGFQWVY